MVGNRSRRNERWETYQGEMKGGKHIKEKQKVGNRSRRNERREADQEETKEGKQINEK